MTREIRGDELNTIRVVADKELSCARLYSDQKSEVV